ncbi:hypothetical protein DIRU0_E29096 [Diutina rugosa]
MLVEGAYAHSLPRGVTSSRCISVATSSSGSFSSPRRLRTYRYHGVFRCAVHDGTPQVKTGTSNHPVRFALADSQGPHFPPQRMYLGERRVPVRSPRSHFPPQRMFLGERRVPFRILRFHFPPQRMFLGERRVSLNP